MRVVCCNWLATVVLSVCFVAQCSAQQPSCADPRNPRVGVLTTIGLKTDPAFLKRTSQVESKLRKSLEEKLLANGACIVEDSAVFDDPNNYPLLNGTVIYTIHAAYEARHLKNPEAAAIVVTLRATEGMYAYQTIDMGEIPVLIEGEADYDIAAEGILKYRQIWGNGPHSVLRSQQQEK